MVYDLPGGARRLIQRADGYRATIVAGEVICTTARRPARCRASWCAAAMSEDVPSRHRSAEPGDAVGSRGPLHVPGVRRARDGSVWPKAWQLACTVDHVANPGDFHEVPGRAALGARRAGRRPRAARVPERVPPPRQRAVRGHRAAASPRSAARSTAGRTTSTGRLREVPSRREFGVLRATTAGTRLIPVRVDTWGPLVFVNLDPDAEPLAEFLARCPATPRGRASTSSAAPPRCRFRRRATGRHSSTGSARRTTCRASTARCCRCATTSTARSRSGSATASCEQSYGLPSPRLRDRPDDQGVGMRSSR